MSRWAHQEKAYEFAVDRDATMLAMAMGTGKSKVVVDLLNEWSRAKSVHNVLVLCPVSVMAVWRREFAKWDQGYFDVIVLDKGTVKDKLNKALSGDHGGAPGNVFVINYESAWRKPFADWALSQWWDVVALDESHRCKAHNTSVSKFVERLSLRAKRRLCLTGTPMPHSPLDVFGQYRFLDWRIFGKRWMAFLHHYAVRGNPGVPQQITGFRDLDLLQERFGRIAYQVGAEVLDLPPVVHDVRGFRLTGKPLTIYRDLERDFCAALDEGLVTAANTLVKTLRLRQVVSGFLQPDDAERVVDLHHEKDAILADILDGTRDPVVVFCEFRQELDRVQHVAKALGRNYGEVSGRAKDLTEHATMPDGIDVLGVQYQSGGVGIDLTRSHYAVYYSPTYNLGNYDQSVARLVRPGQTESVRIYHLVAQGTVDEIVYRALDQKRNVVESVLAGLKLRQEDRYAV